MSLSDYSDKELVRLFCRGESAAFDTLLRRHQDRVFRLACLWLFDEQHAADVAQEVFLRGFKGLRKFRFRAEPFTWLYRTTRLVCNEFNRKRTNEVLDEEPVDECQSPARIIAGLDTARRVRDLVSTLPERQREVVVLRFFEEMSVAQTAVLMGCREGTVKALLHKATTNLKVRVGDTGIML